MTGYHRFIILLLVPILTITLTTITLLYQYDPLRLFSRHADEPIRVVSDLRQQAISFIRYTDYESVILGSSIMENASADQATKLFDEQFINLSLSGSTYFIRSFPLRKILQNRPVKTIIYSVDFLYKAAYGDLPVDYLYDDNRLNDFAVYLNKKYMQCLLEWSNSDSCRGVETTLDMPKNWMQYESHMKRFGGAESWKKNQDNAQIAHALKNWGMAIEAVENNSPILIPKRQEKYYTEKITQQLNEGLITYVRKYPNTRFIAVFPPYFINLFAQWQQSYPSRMCRYLHTLRYLVKQSEHYPNLQVYAFINNDYTNDIANYKDETHYHPDINRAMIAEIAAGKNRVTSENLDIIIRLLQNRAASYDLAKAYELFTYP